VNTAILCNPLLKRRAVLDIGSNTIRLLIADVNTSKQTIHKIHYQHQIARLGEGLQHTGMLSEAGMQRAMQVFISVVETCKTFDIDARDIVAVATAAIREASNGQAYVQGNRMRTRVYIPIIYFHTYEHFTF
jgi:exopolyphosphatase/guanosine-5'-triphosphate,3'-diphosphate pyrophosphatase